MNREQKDPQYETRLQYGSEDFGLSAFNNSELPTRAGGNAYLNGASTFENEANPLELTYDPDIQLEENAEGVFLSINMDRKLYRMKNQPVTTELLGKALISGQGYLNPDNSPIVIDTDFLGKKRSRGNPVPGPFEIRGGIHKISLKQ